MKPLSLERLRLAALWLAFCLVPVYGPFGCGSSFAAANAAQAGSAGGADSERAGAAPAGQGGGLTDNGGAVEGGAAGLGGEAGVDVELPALQGQAVSPDEIELQPTVTVGLPEFVLLTNYDTDETTASETSPPHDAPLYQPYDSTDPAWWDDLVAEETQARVTTIALPSRGAYTLDGSDNEGPGNENPRRLSAWTDAVERANAAGLFRALCVVDTPYLQAVANRLRGFASGTAFDLSNSGDWNEVVWKRAVDPWFSTVASSYWFSLGGQPIIAFTGLPAGGVSNASNNLSKLLSAVATSFHSAHGVYPSYFLDATWFAADPTLSANPYVSGKIPWFTPSNAASAFTTYQNMKLGSAVPGFVSPLYYDPTSAHYRDPSLVIPRTSVDAYGGSVVTLQTALSSSVQNGVGLTFLEGFDDYTQRASIYRSESPDWSSANQYLNLLRRYADPQTVTLRLEAEGCDRYSDTTPGNSGHAFRRGGDLDVRPLSSANGWAVTNTAAGEWLEFEDLDLSAGNYDFIAQYATSRAGDGDSGQKRVELVLDGVRFAPVLLPDTPNSDTFQNVLLGQQQLNHGQHTLRVRFLDGRVDLDFLFIAKTDALLSLQAANGLYLSAQNAGGGAIYASSMGAYTYESFRFDDLSHGTLQDGDSVFLQTWNGLYVSVQAGTLAVTAEKRQPGAQDQFVVRVQGGGPVVKGSVVSVESADQKHFLSVRADGSLDATGTTNGPNQTFSVFR